MQAPRRLQLRRGNTAAVSTYVGAPGELIVNTTTNTLYLHDGVTVGGTATTVDAAGILSNIANLTANAGAQAGSISTLTSNAAVQAGNIATIFANLGATSGTLATINSNLGAVAGSLTTLTANAATQAGDIATIYANLGAVSGSIATLTSNAATQAGTLATLTANAAVQAGLLDTLTGNAASQGGELASLVANAATQAGALATLTSNAASQSGTLADLIANAAVQAGLIASSAGTYSNANVKTYLSNFNGNLIPSANVTYSLGSITNQWKDLFVSNNTIYIGGVPLSIDAGGNLLVNGNVVQGTAGNITLPAGGIITAPVNQEFQLQAKDANSVLRNEINLDPNNGTYMSVWSDGTTSFSSADWDTGSWNNESGLGAARFTDAQALQNFWTTGIGSLGLPIEASINGGARTPNVFYDGNNGETYGVTLGLDAVPPGGQGTTVPITSLVFYYQTQSKINMDVDGGEILVDAQSMDLDLRTTLILDLRAGENLNLRGLGAYPVRIYTNNSTHMWEFDTAGSLTLPSQGKIYGIGAPNDRYGYMSWTGNTSGDGQGWNTIRLVPDLQGLEDADTYIILDPAYDGQTGNIHIRAGGTRDNSLANLYLGGANSHVKIGAGLNPPVTVKANNKSWTFGTDGTTTFSGNLVIAGNTSVFGTNGALIQPANDLPLLALSSGANGAVSSIWVEDIGNIGTSNIAAVYANPTVGSKIVRIAVGQNGGAGPKLWDFGNTGTTRFPDGTILAPAGQNITMQSDQNSQLLYQNANVAVAPNVPTNTTFSVQPNFATLVVGYQDGNSAQQDNTWLWNIDGMTLPEGGTITEGGGISGAIRLTPAGGANANQALVIYPTAGAPEGDHIHLTAGGGATELYLGDDYHYVKLVDGGNVEVKATTANFSDTASWTFGTDGSLASDDEFIIKAPNGVPTSVYNYSGGGGWNSPPYTNLATTTNNLGTGLTVNVSTAVGGYININAITINTPGTGYKTGDIITITNENSLTGTFVVGVAGTRSWTFGTDGNLTLPSDGYLRITSGITTTGASPAPIISGFTITNSQGISGNGNITTTQYVNAGYFTGNGALLTGIVASGSTYSNSNVASYLPTYTGNIAGNIVKNGYTWTFSNTGTTTFPTGVRLSNARGANTVNFTTDIDKSFQIETQTSTTGRLWSFGTDGNLTLPQNANINFSNGVSILSTVTDLYANAAVQAGSLATITSVLTSTNVAIGENAAYTAQGQYAVAIGLYAGGDTQGERAVAIGSNAGKTSQGAYAVAIGRRAGETNQGNNSIIINATTGTLNQTTANTFTVAPIRIDSGNVAQALYYNTTTKEVTYANVTAGSYSNVQVATYLPTYSGNVSALNFVGAIQAQVGSSFAYATDAYGSLFVSGGVALPADTNSNAIVAGYTIVGNSGAVTLTVTSATFIPGTPNIVQVATTPTASLLAFPVTVYTANYSPAKSSTITVGNATVSGNVSAQYFLGNGALLTGIVASGGNYSNANVATYLTNYDGDINFTSSVAIISNVDVITVLDHIRSPSYQYSNGVSILSGLGYGNTEVASYLPIYTGNITAGNVIATRFIGNTIGTTATYTGNVSAANFVGNISITGNVTGTSANVTLQAGSYSSTFNNQGNVILPNLAVSGNVISGGYFLGNGALLTGVATKITGSWTVPTGNSTQSFTVPTSGTYQLWVDCNIPNGIIAWNATATITNTNVPVVGAQYAWVYNGNGSPIDFTSIPNQFVGTANTIVRSSVAPSGTTNQFDFGLNNTSGGNVTVSYGYVKIS